MNDILILLIALLLGFGVTYKFNYISDPNASTSRLQELIYFTDNSCYHIHHYIWLFLLIMALLIARYIPDEKVFYIIIAFIMGCGLEGFLFDDWMLIKNNCHKDKIIKLFKKNDAR